MIDVQTYIFKWLHKNMAFTVQGLHPFIQSTSV